MIVYIDMDGVLADFDRRREELVGDVYGTSATSNLRNPKKDQAFWKEIYKKDPDFFANLPAMKDAQILWEYVQDWHEPIILSALPSQNFESRAACLYQKIRWLRWHIGLDAPAIFCLRSHKKDYAKPDTVLIDDTPLNVEEFVKKGGNGILHTSANESIAQLEKITAMARQK